MVAAFVFSGGFCYGSPPFQNRPIREPFAMATLKQLVAGNWKMNGTAASLAEIDAVKAGIGGSTAEVAICPPATLIAQAAARAKGSALLIGGQDCHPRANGAHTGDVS